MSVRSPVFKTVLIGEGGVGKTSLAIRYTEDRFDQQMKMTIGVNFATKKLNIAGSKLGIAVYEVSRPFTMHRLDDWIGRLHSSVPDCDVFIVGNKIDERIPGVGVTREEAEEYAEKYNAQTFEVSAKSGVGVQQLKYT